MNCKALHELNAGVHELLSLTVKHELQAKLALWNYFLIFTIMNFGDKIQFMERSENS